ncbi:palmitoyltransferase ZDHHC7 [Sarcoptes scabiei]|nr:palmitoyltransferase ZDHHC7 [Sarcoptes scabiei]
MHKFFSKSYCFNYLLIRNKVINSTNIHHNLYWSSIESLIRYRNLIILNPTKINATSFHNSAKKFSIKSKVKTIDSEQCNTVEKPLTSIVELDEKQFKELSKDLNFLNDLKSIENVDQYVSCEDQWKDVRPIKFQTLMKDYQKLSKLKLTGLVVLTTLSGFYMGMDQSSMNWTLLSSTLIGTALTSGSAASWNHYLEVPFDSQMRRTQARPLVLGTISPLHVVSFALVSGTAGLTILASNVNLLTAALGGFNLLLYALVYTPMKRIHISNTLIGGIVGAIPPVMGFTAINNQIDLSALLLGLVLYSWQFPHFNALSWNMRHEYARAGYRMMSVTNPKLCVDTAHRHSMFLMAYITAICGTGICHWSFALGTLPFSLYLIYLSNRFRNSPQSQTSRKLFLYSLIYLPVIMIAMILTKNHNNQKNCKNKTSI